MVALNVIYTIGQCQYQYLAKDTWWRHQMETFSALLALYAGNSPVPVNSPHKDQWRGALMFSLICAWINDWVNNREAGDLRRQHGHYDVIVMILSDRMATSWHGNLSSILALCEGNLPFTLLPTRTSYGTNSRVSDDLRRHLSHVM